jgi:hypothetical protein
VHFPLPAGAFYEKWTVSANEFPTFPTKANTFGLVCLAKKPAKFQKPKSRKSKVPSEKFPEAEEVDSFSERNSNRKTTRDKKIRDFYGGRSS